MDTPGLGSRVRTSTALRYVFVLGLKYTELHLPWLQKLSQILIDRDRVRSILAAPDALAIVKILQEAERSLAPPPPIDDGASLSE